MPDSPAPVIARFLEQSRADVERQIRAWYTARRNVPPVLRRACLYALGGGGKRIRPALAIAACRAAGGARADVLPAACALELIHSYSLAHDDLPCMDDDDERRGRPSLHRAFGEAMAVLAGDALLTDAFSIAAHGLSRRFGGDPRPAAAIAELADAAGSAGMVGGQVLDTTGDGGRPRGREWMEGMFALKTGRLLRCAVRLGGICAGAPAPAMRVLTRYGEAVGLAFQITDDILDVSASSGQLGKTAGKDPKAGKLTYPALVGLEQSKRIARDLTDQAVAALARFGPKARRLRCLATTLLDRDR